MRGRVMLTPEQVRERLRDECAKWGTQTALARHIGVSVQCLNDVLRGLRRPNPAIRAHLGISEQMMYLQTEGTEGGKEGETGSTETKRPA